MVKIAHNDKMVVDKSLGLNCFDNDIYCQFHLSCRVKTSRYQFQFLMIHLKIYIFLRTIEIN